MRLAAALALCLLVGQNTAYQALSAEPFSPVINDYGAAVEAAQQRGCLLGVVVGLQCELPPVEGLIRCHNPPGWKQLAAHESLKWLDGRGIFIADHDGRRADQRGVIISILPRRHCTPSKLRALVALPRVNLTQRTMIWAIRVHPERPQSTDGTASSLLFAHAATNNRRQAGRKQQGHHTPIGYLGDASEIAAESWPWSRNIADGAIDCVDSWRRSSGHWGEACRPHAAFGYDMQPGQSNWFGGQEVWFATGVFQK